ncbi:MAG: DUF4398 domain-containing protein [Bradymonadia bacterium]
MCRSITRIILIGIVSLVGCGPITSQGLIKEARVAIDKAEKEGANIGAPYELFGALERYKKAREEQGYSDYQAAMDLAKEALKLAETAYAKTAAGGDPLQRIDPERRKALKKRSAR